LPKDEWPAEKATKDLMVKEDDMELKASVLVAVDVKSAVDFNQLKGYQEAMWETAQKLRTPNEGNEVSMNDLEVARKFLVKEAQRESFPEEIQLLNEGKLIGKKS